MPLLDTVNEIEQSRERFQRRSQGQMRRRMMDDGMSMEQALVSSAPAPRINMRRAMSALHESFKQGRATVLQNRDRQMRMMQAMGEQAQPAPEAAQAAQAPQGPQAPQAPMMGGMQGMQPQMAQQAPQGQPSPFGGGLLG
jgi:hypothetical protein